MNFNFNWSKFTEVDYKNFMKELEEDNYNVDCIGHIYVGDIRIELVVDGYYIGEEFKEDLLCNFYVAHEDTGYGYKDENGYANVDGNGMPYDYADGDGIDIPYGLTYEEFKVKAEKMFTEYIVVNDKWGDYSLVEHANRPLEIW